MVGLAKTDFNSMLNLGPSFLRFVGAYKIYTDLDPWKSPQKYH